jgi:hypothetical protein
VGFNEEIIVVGCTVFVGLAEVEAECTTDGIFNVGPHNDSLVEGCIVCFKDTIAEGEWVGDCIIGKDVMLECLIDGIEERSEWMDVGVVVVVVVIIVVVVGLAEIEAVCTTDGIFDIGINDASLREGCIVCFKGTIIEGDWVGDCIQGVDDMLDWLIEGIDECSDWMDGGVVGVVVILVVVVGLAEVAAVISTDGIFDDEISEGLEGWLVCCNGKVVEGDCIIGAADIMAWMIEGIEVCSDWIDGWVVAVGIIVDVVAVVVVGWDETEAEFTTDGSISDGKNTDSLLVGCIVCSIGTTREGEIEGLEECSDRMNGNGENFDKKGVSDSDWVGFRLGIRNLDGSLDGCFVRARRGLRIGFDTGLREGFVEGKCEGFDDGLADGVCRLGRRDGFDDGVREGVADGCLMCLREGFDDGARKGFVDGCRLGLTVGFNVGALVGTTSST